MQYLANLIRQQYAAALERGMIRPFVCAYDMRSDFGRRMLSEQFPNEVDWAQSQAAGIADGGAQAGSVPYCVLCFEAETVRPMIETLSEGLRDLLTVPEGSIACLAYLPDGAVALAVEIKQPDE